MAKGALNLHGHSHGRMTPLARQIDVGVDCWDFAPVALDRLLAATKRRKAKAAADSPGRRAARNASG
jgi:calcineurin-like phosphoesterase family protein